MDTTDKTTGDLYNAAIAAQLRILKAGIGKSMTFSALEALTGIKLRQLKYLFNDQRSIHMSEYMVILQALGKDPAEAMAEAQAVVEKTSPASKP